MGGSALSSVSRGCRPADPPAAAAGQVSDLATKGREAASKGWDFLSGLVHTAKTQASCTACPALLCSALPTPARCRRLACLPRRTASSRSPRTLPR